MRIGGFRTAWFIALLALAYLAGSWARPGVDPEWIKIRYGAWGGPGVNPAPGPMDSVLLKDYAPKSSIVARETFIAKARTPVIDAHAHINANTPAEVQAWVRTMDEVGIESTIILTGATGAKFDRLVELYLKPYPTRFQLFRGLDTTHFDQSDYQERVVAELVRCYRKGARGAGELTDKGYGLSGDTSLPARSPAAPG